MASLIGNKPNQVPTNGDLGKMAFQDSDNVNIGGGTAVLSTATVTNPQIDTQITDVRPSLNLDFAKSKVLDPRITFTRASTATYYDGKTTAVAEQNLVLYSQDIDNAYWTKADVTVTANSVAAPDGTTTAETITEAITTAPHLSYSGNIAVTSGQVYTQSFYLKNNTRQFAQILFNSTYFGSNAWANFDLTNGILGTIGSSATASIISVGSGWYRCVVTATATSSGNDAASVCLINSASATRALSYLGTGTSIYAWGAQYEQRSSVTAYTPTTTAAITNYIPALQTASSGVARFDHNPTTSESLGLLIEESRTNQLTYSQDLSNAAWVKDASSVNTALTIAPDGTLSALKLVPDTTASTAHRIRQLTTNAATTQSYLVYVKSAGYTWIKLRVASQWINFNTITGEFGFFSGVTNPIAKNVGNGWWSVSATYAVTLSNQYAYAYICPDDNNSVDSTSFTGNGYSGVFLWGAQLEAGSFATSYIPTTSATVTRAADSASMTGTNFSSWYNQGQGSFYCSLSISTTVPAYTGFFNVQTSNVASVQAYSQGANNVTFVTGTSITQSFGSNQSFAVSYTTNTSAIVASGVSATTSNIGVGSLTGNTFVIGNSTFPKQLNGYMKKLTYFPKALTSTELQEMTL